MKRIFAFVLLVALGSAGQIKLVRDGTASFPRPQPSTPNLTLKLVSETGTQSMPVRRFQSLRLFRDFLAPQPTEGRDERNVLVLKVEFVEDDLPCTSGDGKMDLTGFGEPEDGLYYDPPHSSVYFDRQMEFLANYYKVNSFGNLTVNYTIKPDHNLESYQLPHEMRYYSGFVEYDAENGLVFYNTYAMEMGLVRIYADAVAMADQDPNIDFSDYDAVIIFHAGTQWQTSINFLRFCDIPSATIPPGALEFYLGVPYILANNGTDTLNFPASINSEMARVDEYMVGAVGTYVHEFGHIIDLPDLYDITGWSNGVGGFCLMGTGGWVGSPNAGAPEGAIPANLSAWSRYYMGWANPVVVTDPDSLITIRASSIDTTQYSVADQTMIKVPISATEYFLIENRQQDVLHKDTIIIDAEDGVPIYVDGGEYDFFLPASGIAIWHIDEDVLNATLSTNTVQVNPERKGVDLEEADGIQHFDAYYYGDSLEYYGSRYDLFFIDDSNKANRHLGPFTNPNSDSYFGKSLIDIDVQSANDTLMDVMVDIGGFQTGFPLVVQSGRHIVDVSYGDLDGNGDWEVVVATENGFVYAYNHDATLYGVRVVASSIATFLGIGDINGDNCEDIALGSGFDIICLDGQTFMPMLGFSFAAGDVIPGAPLVFDVNGDGTAELIFGSKDRNLYCIDSTGQNLSGFPIYLNTELLSTPCVFSEADREIGVLGSDGRFWLVNEDGIIKEFRDASHNMLTYASPVVGDMDRDGAPEALIVNGYGTIYIFGRDTLEEKYDILIDTVFYYTPALADIEHDAFLEAVIPNSSKTLYVANRNGTAANNFPLQLEEYILYPLMVADLDANGVEEIVFGVEDSDSLGNGYLRIINDQKNEFSFSPLFGEGGFSSPGSVFDLDGDGDLELACGSDGGLLYIWDFPGTNVSWGGYMNSRANLGRFQAGLSAPPVSSVLLGSHYMYPSPVENLGRARFFLHQAAEVTVEILDITGRRIGEAQMPNPTPNEYNEVEFDFTRQSNGMYILRVEAKNGSQREVKFSKFAILR